MIPFRKQSECDKHQFLTYHVTELFHYPKGEMLYRYFQACQLCGQAICWDSSEIVEE